MEKHNGLHNQLAELNKHIVWELCHIQPYANHILYLNRFCTETDNTLLYIIKKKVDNKYAKSSCAPPNRYKAMVCTTKVYIDTELHCEP